MVAFTFFKQDNKIYVERPYCFDRKKRYKQFPALRFHKLKTEAGISKNDDSGFAH